MLHSIPHQIAQSPARLGLTNPNSPSLPNPTALNIPSQAQQSHPSQQHSILSIAPKTSSALLSLLPPLPRAQSLLLQMASLASSLFEVSPKKSLWLTSFRGSLPSFLPSQTSSINPSPSAPEEILSLFTTLQTQLFEAIAELQEILDLQDAKQKLFREIRVKDSAILSFANKLKEAEHVLDMLVDDYLDYRQPKRSKSEDGAGWPSSSFTTVALKINLSDILSYAHRISYTTFAPPEFGGGQAPLRGALPPAPQDEQLRASQLYHFADLDVGLPKTVKDEEKTIGGLIEQPVSLQESNRLANLPGLPGMHPPSIMVPSGWKPGMPVELPSDFPILPPDGWKPGDPVPLPGLDSLPVPPLRGEEQQVRAVASQGVPKAAEPIQVPWVNLDILGQDDESSDYSSSDIGSSEDED